MKFLIEGTMGSDERQFKMEIEAKTKKHAENLAYIKIGSANGLRKSQIDILKVQESK